MSNDIEEALRLFNLLNDKTRTMLIEMINTEDTLKQQSQPDRGDFRQLSDNRVLPCETCPMRN